MDSIESMYIRISNDFHGVLRISIDSMDFHAPFSGYYPGGGQAQEGGRGAQIKQVGVRPNATIQVK